MADDAKRADLGFQGGQVLSVRVSQESLDSMRKALGN